MQDEKHYRHFHAAYPPTPRSGNRANYSYTEKESGATLEGGAVFFLKAMDDIGVVMTPFGDVVTVILVANSF